MSKTLALILIFLSLLTSAALAQTPCGSFNDSQIHVAPNYLTFTPPARGTTYNDPQYGCPITRITDAYAQGLPGNTAYHAYSQQIAFNSDNTKILLQAGGSNAFITDFSGNILTSPGLLEINLNGDDPYWSNTNPNIIYYHKGNQIKKVDVSNPAAPVITVLHTFTQFGSLVSTGGSGNIAWDNDHLIFLSSTGYAGVYTISTDTVGPATAGFGNINSMDFTPSGLVAIYWNPSGTCRGCGIELYDQNMNFVKQLYAYPTHSAFGKDINGSDIWVSEASTDGAPTTLPAACGNSSGIIKINIATLQKTCLVKFGYALSGHVSLYNLNGNPYALFETYDNRYPGTASIPVESNYATDWPLYDNEFVLVKLDGSEIRRLAHHRSLMAVSGGYNYWGTPRAAVSRDGKYVVFDSNYGQNTANSVYSDVYLINLGASSVSPPPPPSSNLITVNPSITYQTMNGWEGVAFAIQDSPAFPNFINTVIDKAVNEVGIDRIRLEIKSGSENTQDFWSQWRAGTLSYALWRCSRYSTINDDSDPNNLNLAGFQFSEFDDTIDKIIIPLRQTVQARGEQLYINLNYVAFVNQMTASGCPAGLQYHHDDSPQEYAEFILAVFTHMQQKYGFVPDAVEIILEPDNTPFWRGKQIGDAIVATAQKLQANGFAVPEFIAPSVTSMSNTVPYFDTMISQAPQSLQYLSEISYHRYGGVSDANLQAIAGRAVQYNLKTSMLEWWSSGNGYLTLHKDLKMGRNSAWEQGVLAGASTASDSLFFVDDTNPANPVVTIGTMTKYTRQYFEFIRKGAVRLDTQSSVSAIDPLAFRNLDGKYVVVMINNGTGSFSVNGLPAGTYGIKYSSISNSANYNINLVDVTIGSGQTLTSSVPSAAVITVYAKSTSISPPPDTTPPSLSGGQPTGQIATGTTQTTLQVTTNENANCKYSTTAGVAYASMTNTFTTTGGTTHSKLLTGLADGTSYNYYVRCQDTSSNLNQNTIDYIITFSVAQITNFGRPTSDVTTGWLGTTVPHWDKLDEVTASDADGIRTGFSAGTQVDEMKLSPVLVPSVKTGHVLRVRAGADGIGCPNKLTYALVQGTTIIASANHSLAACPSGYTTETLTLTTAQASQITDYSDLRVRLTGNAVNARVFVSWIEFEVPTGGSPPFSGLILNGRITRTTSGTPCASCTIDITLAGQSGSATTNAAGDFSIVLTNSVAAGQYVADISINDLTTTQNFKRRVTV